LLGITLQLVGGGGSRFGYRGSVGPIGKPRAVCEILERVGSTLAARFGLRGLFGIDYIDREGMPVPIEVNPRYTASIEVLELTSGTPFLSAHRLAFDPSAGPEVSRSPATEPVLGKRVLFARQSLRVPDNPPWEDAPPDPWKIPAVADLPHPGTTFAPGEPVLTVFAPGNDPTDCRRNLDAAAGRWTRAFGDWTI
jgi:predicted ATP-grasp superfamily ATP-dependent carboligase